MRSLSVTALGGNFMFLVLFLLVIIGVLVFLWIQILRRNAHIWLGSYVRQQLRPAPRAPAASPVHIMFCVVDHYEPLWRQADIRLGRKRVEKWLRDYPRLADRHRDGDGIAPQHTFFYPQEEYRPELLEMLAQLCHGGYGEVEVHLHHDGDSGDRLGHKLETFKDQLVSHGLLSRNARDGRVQYGFIHGNWALDNSRRDGRWCGVNDELLILKRTGCYADFTLPTAPSETQTRKINSIYYATDDPERPKSHNTGIDARVHRAPSGDLMIVQGPLILDWKRRKWGLLPGIDAGEIKGDNSPSEHRVDLWMRPGIHIRGRPDWVFVKIFTHGTQERNQEVLFGRPMDDVFTYLEHNYNDGERYRLHYVTTREMFNIIRAAEEGHRGDPHRYRNYLLRPVASGSSAAFVPPL
jgi:hypothetical protein